MFWLHDVSYFFGGMFCANAIPHAVSGMCGRSFQSPFATPSGRGLSSSTVNVLWGAVNLALGYVLILHVGAFHAHNPTQAATAASGALLIALVSAHHFGRFHGGHAPGSADASGTG